VVAAADGRASLMEAIRNAGGTGKLRSVKERKMEAKKKIQVSHRSPAITHQSHELPWMVDTFEKLAIPQ
jgi:WAS family protein 1